MTIRSAARSFTEPVGLWSSSFAHSRTSGEGASFGRPTRGVRPTASSRESNRMGTGLPAPGDRGQDAHHVAVVQLRLQAAADADVLVVDVDVHELPQVVAFDQALPEAVVPGLQVVEQLLERAALAFDDLGAVGVGAQNGRDANFDGHGLDLLGSRGLSRQAENAG